MAKIKVTKSIAKEGTVTAETAEIKASTLEKMADTRLKQVERMEKTINRLLDNVAKIQNKNPNNKDTTKDLLQKIKLEEALMGLQRAQISHAEFIESHEKRVREMNKNAYKENMLYRAYSAVRDEQNSSFTAGAANIGLAALTGINPVVANALHLDKIITAPITALVKGLLGLGHKTSSAIKNAEDSEKREKIQEIAKGVKSIDKRLVDLNGKAEKEKESGGFLSFLGNAIGGLAAMFAGSLILDAVGAPEWLKKVLPAAFMGYSLGGIPGAIVGGLFGFFSDDIIKMIEEASPGIGKFFKDLPETLNNAINNFLTDSPIIKSASERINKAIEDGIANIAETTKKEINNQLAKIAAGAVAFFGGSSLAKWGTKALAGYTFKKGAELAVDAAKSIKNIFSSKAGEGTIPTTDKKTPNTATPKAGNAKKPISKAAANIANDNLKTKAANDNVKVLTKSKSTSVKSPKLAGKMLRTTVGKGAIALGAGIGAYDAYETAKSDLGKSVSETAMLNAFAPLKEDWDALNASYLKFYEKLLIGTAIAAKSIWYAPQMAGALSVAGGGKINEIQNGLLSDENGFVSIKTENLVSSLQKALDNPNENSKAQIEKLDAILEEIKLSNNMREEYMSEENARLQQDITLAQTGASYSAYNQPSISNRLNAW